MLSKTAELRQFEPKSDAVRMRRRLRGCLQTSVLALACVAAAGTSPALARTPYDGTWSVVILTRAGSCEPSFRYPIQIADGRVINADGSPANVQGRVGPAGAVTVSVQSGNQSANGSGHLSVTRGSGIWRGQGTGGLCQGTWVAQRQGNGATAQAASPPVQGNAPRTYNYVPRTIAPAADAGGAVAYCEAHFRSYNPATGTYLGYDGMRHPCP